MLFIGMLSFTSCVKPPRENSVKKTYYENGNIKKEITYKDGKIEGVVKEYYEDGALRIETSDVSSVPFY